MDDAPLLETDWYDPEDFDFVKSTSYVFKHGYYVKLSQTGSVNYTQKQPKYSIFYGCTAAIMDVSRHSEDRYPWITIPCHKKFHASYFCQPLNEFMLIPVQISGDVKCNDDWLEIHGSDNCFLVLDSGHSKMSFYDSQYMCSLYNASVFKVDISERVNAVDEIREIKSDLLLGMASSANDELIHTVQNMSRVNIRDMLFGRRLDSHSVQSILPYLLQNAYIETGDPKASMSYFADDNNTCSIVEFLEISYTYQDTSYISDEWGVKYRPCSEKIKVSGLICEKPAVINIIKCKTPQFECRDKTCILYVYKCDHVFDCFDQSDEDGCMNNTRSTDDQFLNMPCPQNSGCDLDIVSKVRVHDICDGIYFHKIFLQEKDICVPYSLTRWWTITKRHRRKTNIASFNYTNTALFSIFMHERKYTRSKQSSEGIYTFNHTMSYIGLVQNALQKQNTKLTDICFFRDQPNICNSPACRIVCMTLVCPGMFKCRDHVCIPLSLYCDKTHHCTRGEDETTCFSITLGCPGYLKCRGEQKCVSTNEICDKKINCRHSMDDEVGCESCPANCECKGYVISCYTNNNNLIVESDEALYTKGLVIKGTQNVLSIKKLKLIGLFYLNISNCRLDKIDILVHHSITQSIVIMFADFSHNQLISTLFLKSYIFQRLVFLDLSFNSLHTFKYGQSFSLSYLSVLYLKGNNILDIEMRIEYGYLTLIDLQLIYYKPELAVGIDHASDVDLVVKVTDSQLCCMLSDDIKCLSTKYDITCYGILQTLSSKAIFYSLSLLSMFVTLGIFLKQALQTFSMDKKSTNERHYCLLLMNQSICNSQSSVYLMAIFAMDLFNVKLIFLKTSILCIMLNAIVYISLEALIVFKSSLSFVIALKIMFPFRHQCTWLKWIVPAIGLVWFSVIVIYVIHLILLFRIQTRPILDKLCSIGWCEMQIDFNILHAMIYIVDQLSILMYVIAFSLTYISLKKYQNKFVCEASNNHYSAIVVTCKCVFANIMEIIFRVYLITILSVKLGHFSTGPFCFSFILYALPINILFFCSINIFR